MPPNVQENCHEFAEIIVSSSLYCDFLLYSSLSDQSTWTCTLKVEKYLEKPLLIISLTQLAGYDFQITRRIKCANISCLRFLFHACLRTAAPTILIPHEYSKLTSIRSCDPRQSIKEVQSSARMIFTNTSRPCVGHQSICFLLEPIAGQNAQGQ